MSTTSIIVPQDSKVKQGQQAAIPPNNLVTIDKRLIRNAVLMGYVLARQNADWQRILKAIQDLEGCAR